MLSLLLALGGVVAFAAPASAAVNIDGYVSDDVNPLTGLQGIEIRIMDSSGTITDGGVTDANGLFSIVPPNGDDDYVVAVGSDDYVWEEQDYNVPAALSPLEFHLHAGVVISGDVTDRNGGADVPDIIVFAIPTSGFPPPPSAFAGGLPFPGYIDYHGPTVAPAVGAGYRITVPLGDEYSLVAFDPTFAFDPQVYQDINLSSSAGCGCGDPVDLTTSPPTTTYDFHLLNHADWVWFSVLGERPASSPLEHVILTLQVDNGLGGGFVTTDTAETDAAGLADLYGLGAGQYRLLSTRLSLPIDIADAEDSGGPLTVTSRIIDLGFYDPSVGCGCGPPFTSFDGDDIYVLYGSEVSPGGGSSSTPPKPSRRGGSSAFSGLPVTTVTPTPTPTPTPTSTPSPSSSPTSEPSPSPTPTSPPREGTGFDILSLWWLLVLLIIGVVVLIIVLVRRR